MKEPGVNRKLENSAPQQHLQYTPSTWTSFLLPGARDVRASNGRKLELSPCPAPAMHQPPLPNSLHWSSPFCPDMMVSLSLCPGIVSVDSLVDPRRL